MTIAALTPAFSKTRMQEVFDRQAATALRLRSSSADERIAKIRKLRDAVIAHTEDCYHAAYADFKKPPGEVDLAGYFILVKIKFIYHFSSVLF